MGDQEKSEYDPRSHILNSELEVWQTADSPQSHSTHLSAAELKAKKLQPITKLTPQLEEGDKGGGGLPAIPTAPLPPITRSPRQTVSGIKSPPLQLPTKPLTYSKEIPSAHSIIYKPLPPTPSSIRNHLYSDSKHRPLHLSNDSKHRPLHLSMDSKHRPLHILSSDSKHRPLPLTPSTTRTLPQTKNPSTLKVINPHIKGFDDPSNTVYVTGGDRGPAVAPIQEAADDYPLYSLIEYNLPLELDKADEDYASRVRNIITSDPYIGQTAAPHPDHDPGVGAPLESDRGGEVPPEPGTGVEAAGDDDYQYTTVPVHDGDDYQNIDDRLYELPSRPSRGKVTTYKNTDQDIGGQAEDEQYIYVRVPSGDMDRMVERQNSTTPLVDRQTSENDAETDFHRQVTTKPHEANGVTKNGALPQIHQSHTNGFVHKNGDVGGDGGLTNGLVRKNSKVSPIIDKEHELGLEKIDECDKLKTKRKTPCCVTLTRVIVALLLGVWFGWMLQKSSVFKPEIIRNQFLFEDFVMFKTFIGALASSQLCFLILTYIPQTKPHITAARKTYIKSFTHKGVISTLLGAFILGSGMAVGGACPGMVLAQIGDLVPNSGYTILGGILGSLVYGLLHKLLIKVTTPNPPYETHLIYEKLNVPYLALVIPAMILCVAGITVMEIFIPEVQNDGPHKLLTTTTTLAQSSSHPSVRVAFRTTNTQPPTTTSGILSVPTSTSSEESSTVYQPVCGDNTNWFTQAMWMPSVCGALIGLVQLPLVLILSDSMGSSSAYQTVASQWVVTKRLKKTFPYMANARHGIQNCWMIFYVLGAGGGAALASLSSCSFLKAPGVPWWQALTGGFLMLFGSRLASGCTSGHGISGAAFLVGLSWLAVPAMFGGGIATTFLMKYTNMNLYVLSWEPVIT